MRSIRLIPCLDVTGGRVVKGVRFVDLTDEGDPVELAARYDAEGADEVTFLDITASSDGRDTMVDVVARTAEQVFIPLDGGWWGPDGGGCTPPPPGRRGQGRGEHGRGRASAIGARHRGRVRGPVRGRGHRRPGASGWTPGWEVHTHGGRTPAGRDVVAWAVECAGNGAGEILLTSMDRDGTRDGFDLALTRAVVDAVDIPVVASGGVGGFRTWSTGRSRGAPTPSWRRRSSTGASSPSARPRPTWRPTGSPSGRPEPCPLTWEGALVRYRARVPTSTTKKGPAAPRPKNLR